MTTSTLHRTALPVYGALWVTTLLSAVIVCTLPGAAELVRSALRDLGLQLRPPAGSADALALSRFGRNTQIALMPLEWAAIGAGGTRTWRSVADAVIVATFAGNAALVGAALGAYGAALVPFVPHVPLEWAALAVGSTPWLIARRRSLGRGDWLGPLLFVVLSLALAAAIETYLTPAGT